MQNTPKVSVLTPIYNVEEYLAKCLNSLKRQTLQDIEFICINDGSTDSSPDILRRVTAGDDRFVIIDKENSGYGASMNMGIERARGEYIGILESDDYADPQMFEELYNLAKANSCDIARGNRYNLTESSDSFSEVLKGLPYGEVFRPLEDQRIFDPAPCIWAQVYRREFLNQNNIRFLETPGASFQDTGFVYKSYIAAERMILTHDAFIHYRLDNAGSSVKSSSKIFCITDEFESIDNYLAERPEADKVFRRAFEALRYQAYRWNYDRLAWNAKSEFLPAFADELRRQSDLGNLDETLFTLRDWEWINKTLQERDAVLNSDAPLVSVIVPAYNCEAHIIDTLRSLSRQSLKDIEVIVVDDGSEDDTLELVEEYCAGDGRFLVVSQENQGVSGARNTGLDNAHGVFVSFIDGEDTVPPIALEMLYRFMEAEAADCAVGVIEEFGLSGKNKFSRTVSLSKKKEIARYDFDLIWTFSVNNKLFRRSIIEERSMRFDTNTLIAEDGVFCMEYILNCGQIVGCPYVVLNYRRDLFWDGFSATRSGSGKHVYDLVQNHEKIIGMAEEALARDVELEEDDIERRKLGVLQKTYINELHRRLVSFLLDLQYRMIWLLDDEAARYASEKYHEHVAFVPEKDFTGMCKWHNDLSLDSGLMDKEEMAAHPLVSCVVCDDASPEDLPEMLYCIYYNRFPRFEVIVSERMVDALPEQFASLGNVRVVPAEFARGRYRQEALRISRAPHIAFLKDRVFYDAGTMKRLWSECSNSQADFVVARVKEIIREENKTHFYRSQHVLFDQEHVHGYSYRDELNQLDCSLNNKLLKTAALRDYGFVFADSTIADNARLYEELEFKKLPKITMITDLSEKRFLAGTSKSLYRKCFLKYYQARAKNKKLVRDKLNGIVKKRIRAFKKLRSNKGLPKSRDLTLFVSNRGMSDNLVLVYEAWDGNKVAMTKLYPHSDAYNAQLMEYVKEARLIVTDDVCPFLRSVRLQKGQHVVQLWHAFGAFKKFGLDNLRVGPVYERNAHNQYDAVMVSSEYVRPIYAQAFGIPESKVLALGSTRSDLLLDENIREARTTAFIARHPELVGKRILLYCPTFRQDNGVQCIWDPKIDWEVLSKSLAQDDVLVVSPHPLERFDLLGGASYPNILRLEDASSGDVLLCADLLITDYSSIVFDAALLDIPVLFYCPDLETYQTGFYLKYPDDLCGTMVEDPARFPEAIESAVALGTDSEQYKMFKKRYLEACDGHSTERIIRYMQTLIES